MFLTGVAFAEGKFQRTKDGKAIVWNNRPVPGDAAEWSGTRDEKGYATGTGTLTWFRTEQNLLTGSNIPMSKHVAENRYTGEMVKGKFEGMVVNVDAKGRTFHGTFVDGHKTKDWAAGPASASVRDIAAKPAESASPAPAMPNESPETKVASEPAEDQRPGPGNSQEDIEPPAAGPPPPRATAVAKHAQPNEKSSTGSTVETPNDYDESLRSLVGPPSGLRLNAKASATPEPSAPSQTQAATTAAAPSPPPAKLTAAQVDEIADAEARTHGYNLGDFQHPQAKYDNLSDSWTVTYDRKSFDGYGMAAVGQSFTVTVQDKTKKTSLAAEK